MSLPSSLSKAFNNFKSGIFAKYANNNDRFLLDTAAIGWLLASLANATGVFFNKKIDKDQKKYMAAQEAADGIVNVAIFCCVTNLLINGAKGLARNGKIGSKTLDEIGKEKFEAGVGTIASLVGAVVTNNIITPIIRNKFATKVQARLGANKPQADTPVYKPTSSIPYTSQKNPISINSYMAFSKSGGNLKI